MVVGFSAAAPFLIDVAANSGTDEIIVQNIYIDARYVGSNAAASFYLPVSVASGAVLKVRAQSSTGAANFRVGVVGFTGSVELQNGFRAVLGATDYTNTDPANSVTPSGTTLTAWTTMQASTPARFSGLYIMPSSESASGRNSGALTFDVGHGTSGNEVVIFSGILTRMAPAAIPSLPSYGPFLCDIPVGSRLAFRLQSNVTSNIATSLAAWGLVA